MIRAVDEFPVREEDFQSYVDGLLQSGRRAAVEAFLARHPAEAERVGAYRAQNILLHEAFDSVVREPLSAPLNDIREELLRRIGRQRVVRRGLRWGAGTLAAGLTVSVVWLAQAGSLPSLLTDWAKRGEPLFLSTSFPQETSAPFSHLALEAHALLAGDASPPLTEKGPEGGDALVSWLSERETKTARPAPNLRKFDLEVSGGRLFLIGDRPIVQLVYADNRHHKLSLYVGAKPEDDGQSMFTFAQQGAFSTFPWRQPRLEFSLVGAMGRDELLTIAQTVHEQLNAGVSARGASAGLGGAARKESAQPRAISAAASPPAMRATGERSVMSGRIDTPVAPFIVLERK